MSKIIWKILWVLAGLLVVGQFIQPDKTNPPHDPALDFIQLTNAPDDVAHLLKVSCYDCHSHQTTYPWYTGITPFNWWIKHHINEGREHLNFSTWGEAPARRRAHKLEECYEQVEEHEMPMASYTWMHTEARLTPQQRELLVAWFKEEQGRVK